MPTALEQLNADTIELTKAAFARQEQGLEKAITTSTGLVGYNLEAPSKKLYPVLSPLRNRITRSTAPVGSTAANWRSIIGINTTNVKAAVAFGTRNSNTISYSEADRSATYKTFGLDDSVQDEAVWLGRGFEDVRALSALATLQATMIEEEKLVLGGLSNTLTLGTPTTPTVTRAAGTAGTWSTTDKAWVIVQALPLYGWLNSDVNGLASVADHSAASAANAGATITATTDVMQCSTAYVNGAMAYAWYVGEGSSLPANSAMYLAAITTVPAVILSGVNTGNVALSTVGATNASGDANAFDGLYPQIIPAGATLTTIDSTGGGGGGVLKRITAGPSITGALVYDMNVSAGASTTLTADNASGIIEFDSVLKALWDWSRIGPTLIIMNSQEALNVTKKIGGSSGLAYRIQISDGQKDVVGGIYVGGYLNKFTSSMTPGNPDVIPFLMHPYIAPGTIVFLSERLPYPNNQVPNVLEIELQQEYADFEWARTQRKYEHGVYAMGVLKHYFPAGCAVIRGVKNG